MTQTQQHNVPALRFLEFSGGWESQKIGKLGYFKNGINKDKSDFGFGIPFVNLMDVFGKRSISTDLKLGLVNASEKEIGNYNLSKGDVIFIRSSVKPSGVGETIVVNEDMPNTVYSGFLIRYRETENSLSHGFMEYCFWVPEFRKRLLSLSTTSANTNINQESLSKILLGFPTLPEQQKIASFLSSVDSKVEQLGKKKTLLEQYKKGMMQKLFSQELRFKDAQGNDYPDWEEKGFGEVAQKVSESFNPSTSSENWQSVELESLGRGNGKILNTFLAQDLQSIKTKFQKGDVLFGKLRPYLRKFAQPDFDGVCTSEIWVLRARSISNEFLFFVVQSERFNQFANIQSGSKMPRSDWKIVSNAKYLVPSVPEQQKIADFLSSIDQKTDLVSTELDHAKTFKKGLLQQMFI